MKYGIPVRIYAFVKNDEDEILISEAGLPKADFLPGKDFRENLSVMLRETCGVKFEEIEVGGILREFGADSCMAVAFWVMDLSGEPTSGWTFQSVASVKHKLPEFHGTLFETCSRARPGVAVV
jgi:hypothetical protein